MADDGIRIAGESSQGRSIPLRIVIGEFIDLERRETAECETRVLATVRPARLGVRDAKITLRH